ncbi:hypothetical protein, partial [Bacillus sp. UNC438CL73TsuS30]|uniref:hypothetical protein n=1 Tax=Bacillus sp. UNC438CL73TsuS30 TaxID=1340434 RepID=UPI001E35E344
SFFTCLGIYRLFRLPIVLFFHLLGHLSPLSIAARTLFPLALASIALFDYRLSFPPCQATT